MGESLLEVPTVLEQLLWNTKAGIRSTAGAKAERIEQAKRF